MRKNRGCYKSVYSENSLSTGGREGFSQKKSTGKLRSEEK